MNSFNSVKNNMNVLNSNYGTFARKDILMPPQFLSGVYTTSLTLYNQSDTNISSFKTLTNAGGNDTFISKYSGNGTGLWATRISGTGTDQAVNMILDSAKNVYISGYYNSTITLYNQNDNTASTFKTLANAGNNDVFIAKYNSNGSGLWATRIAGTGSDVPVKLVLDSSNNLYIYGYYNSDLTLYNTNGRVFKTLANSSVNDIFIAKYNSDGSGIWATLIGGMIDDSTWIARQSNRDWTSVCMSSDGKYQTAVAYYANIYISSDYGINWTAKESGRNWYGVCMSSDGKYQTSTSNWGTYISSDYGNSWTVKTTPPASGSVCMSSDGLYQTVASSAAGVNVFQIYISSDYGNTWTAKESNRTWTAVCMSSTGKYQTAVANLAQIYISSDYGNTWTAKETSGNWNSVCMSSDGKYQSAARSYFIHTSTNYGNNWIITGSLTDFRDTMYLCMSSSGQYQTAVKAGGQIYMSNDYGNTWILINNVSGRNWSSVCMSSDGQYQTATTYGRQIYTYISTNIISNPVSLLLDSANNIYICGYYNVNLKLYNSTDTTTSTFKSLTNAGGNDIFVAKYNKDGSGIWVTRIAGTGTDQPVNMILDSTNNVYISGYYGSTLTLYNSRDTTTSTFKTLTNAGSNDTFVAKYNSDGSGIWATQIASTGADQPVNLLLDSANNVYISGNYTANLTLYNSIDTTTSSFKTLTNDGSTNTFISKYNSDGSGIWATQIGGQPIIDMTTFGNNWVQKATSLGNQNWLGIAMSSNGQYQTAVVYGGNGKNIYVSTDTGNTWVGKISSQISGNWNGVAMSSNGQYQTVVASNDYIWVSNNTGNNWDVKATSIGYKYWNGIAMSSNGLYQTAVAANDYIYVSTDTGNTWVQKATLQNWKSIAMSSNGQYQTAVAANDYIYVSTDNGNTWVQKATVQNNWTQNWKRVAMSSNGQYQTAVVYGEYIYVSTDTGNTWVQKATVQNWFGIAMSSTGQYQTAVINNFGIIYVSTDTGNTWYSKASSDNWTSVAMSPNGQYQSATTSNGYLYTSNIGSVNSSNNSLNLTLDSTNNLYISGYYSIQISLYNSTDTNTSSFKTLTNSGGTDTFVAKYNNSGIGQWATRISDTSNNQPVNLLLDTANNVYISGYYGSNVTLYNSTDTTTSTFKTLTNAGGSDTFIAKYNSDGSGIWATRISGAGSDVPVNMIVKQN
jgi:hypothetical protein